MSAPEAADVVDTSVLFESVRFGALTLRNRFLLTCTHLGRYTLEPEEHLENLCSYVATRAAGGVSALVMTSIGNANVDAQPLENDSNTWVAEHPDHLHPLVESAHAHGAHVGMQLKHMGVRAVPGASERWAPSAVAPDGQALPVELTQDQILTIIDRFGRSAALMKTQGFDFVEIHGGHGFLVNQFMSPRSNLRTDDWGGRDGGVRFLRAVIDSVRAAVGPDTPVSLRISSSERAPGGLEIDDMVSILREVDDLVDLVNVSGGTPNSLPGIVPLYSSPYAYNVQHAARLKEVLATPVAAVGRLWQPARMVEAVRSGGTDLIGMARALWADPELPNKIRDSRVDEIRPAIGCNQGCIDRDDTSVRTCLVNPLLGREHEYPKDRDMQPRRVAVIGGGVSGLEAARSLTERGHRVTVFEKSTELGGRWRLAARVPGKAEFGGFLEWLVRDCRRGGVEIRLNEAFVPTAHSAGDWDVVVVAAGATYTAEESPGVAVMTPDRAIEQSWLVGADVLVVGADRLHAETALYLASIGRRVTLHTNGGEICADAGPSVRRSTKAMLHAARVMLDERPATFVEWREFQCVIGPVNATTPDEFVTACEQRFAETRVVGDAHRPGSGLEAIAEGVWLAASL